MFIAFITLVGSVYLGQGSQAAVTGQRVHDKQERLEWTLRENDQLRLEITVLTAPDRVEARARQLGFHPASTAQVKFAPIKDYARDPLPAAPVGAIRPALTAADETFNFPIWWNGLLARFGLTGAQAAEATSQ